MKCSDSQKSIEAKRAFVAKQTQEAEAADLIEQLVAKSEMLKKQLELGFDNFKVWYEMGKEKHSICMGETERMQFFEILQALQGKEGSE